VPSCCVPIAAAGAGSCRSLGLEFAPAFGERLAPRFSDHHPDDSLLSAGVHSPRLDGCEPIPCQGTEHFGREAMRQHCRDGAAAVRAVKRVAHGFEVLGLKSDPMGSRSWHVGATDVRSGAIPGQRMCDYLNREGPDPKGKCSGRGPTQGRFLAPSGELNTDPARSA
jgi:hypothetical protein